MFIWAMKQLVAYKITNKIKQHTSINNKLINNNRSETIPKKVNLVGIFCFGFFTSLGFIPLNSHAQDYAVTIGVSATGNVTGSPVRNSTNRQDPLNTVGQTSPSISKDICPANPTPGCDFSGSDLLIRTNDLIDYDVDYSLSAGDDTNVTFTSTLPEKYKWQFLPSFCSGAGSSISNEGRQIRCNLGDKTSGTSQTLPFRVRVLGQAHESTIQIQGTVAGDSGDNATSVLSPTVTVTAAPRWDIRAGSSSNPASTTLNGVTGLRQSIFFYNGTRDVWAGVEPIEGPYSFQFDVTPNTLLQNCNIGTCTQPGGKGTPVFITVDDTTFLDTYIPSGNGGNLSEYTAVLKSINLFISADDVVANGGSAPIGGVYSNFNPVGLSGQENYLGQAEQPSNNGGFRTGRVLSVSNDKRFLDRLVAAGQDLDFYLFVSNKASLVPLTNVELCDVLDLRHFTLKDASPGSAVISNNPVSASAVVEYANTYTAGSPPADDDFFSIAETLAECNDPNTVWYPSTTAAGGASNVTKIRVRLDNEIAAGGSFRMDFAGTVLLTGAPADTYIGNHSALKLDEIQNGEYFTRAYNVASGGGNTNINSFGDRARIGNSEVRITKKTDDPNVAAFPDNRISNSTPGNSVRYVIEPSLTSARNPLINADVKVVDVLPSGLEYVSASPLPDSIQIDTPSAGETTITWDFPNSIPNLPLPVITLDTLVTLETTNNQILTNSAVVSSPEDLSSLIANRTATRNITVSSPGQVNVQKVVNSATIEPGDTLIYTLRYSNGTSTELNDINLIDILPYDSDLRGSSLESGSTINLQDPTTGLPTGVTGTYSKDDPTLIFEDPDHPTNQSGGSTTWCLPANFNTGNCPANFSEVTAVRFNDVTPYPSGNAVREISISMIPLINKPSNVYNNTFKLNAQGLSLPVGSSSASTTVVGVGIGGTIFKDIDNDGSFIPANDDGIFNGVTVELYESGTAPDTHPPFKTTTSNDAGIYNFDLLVPGSYFVHIRQNSIDALTGDNVSSSGANAAVNSDTDDDDDSVDDGFEIATGVQSADINLTVGGEPTNDGIVASQTANDSMNLTVDFGFTRSPSDFGDAPDFYSTLESSGGPYHTITNDLQLGSIIDADLDGFVDGIDDNQDATDDNDASGSGNGNDEDGITSFPVLNNLVTDYTIPAASINVTNSTAGSATLHAWIDFNGNGVFEEAEHSSVTVSSGSSNPANDLNWANLSGLEAKSTYARFRLTSDSSITSTTPGGYANNGEVEDYALEILLPVIDAIDNPVVNISPVEGVDGKTNVTNVLTGDSLNNATINPADVVVTTEVVNPNLTLNPNGTVDVKAGTPAGTHQLTYKICEVANPTNCDTAIASVNVAPTLVIDAVDNPVVNVSPVEGVDGKTNVTNVLIGDSLNNATINPADVVVTTEVVNPNLTLNPNGTVDVKAGTPAGTHQLTYKICEVANPTNCDTAIASVTVAPTQVIDAIDNPVVNVSPVEGVDGKTNVTNVLTGDSLNNATIDPADVLVTTEVANPNLTLNDDGSVDVNPATPAGNYELTYKICEVANPENCDTAIASVTVGDTLVIEAIDNPVVEVTTAEGNDGKSNVTNVLIDDTLNNSTIDPAEVLITTEIANPNLTLNDDGSIDVNAGTLPGNYELTYKICEVANPSNCDIATASVTVAETLAINAIDNPVVEMTATEGSDGKVNVTNVLTDDTLNNTTIDPAEVLITTEVANPNLTLNDDGSVDVNPGTLAGMYELTYKICEIANPSNCDIAIASVTVLAMPQAITATNITAPSLNVGESTPNLFNVFDNDVLNNEPVDPNLITARIITPALSVNGSPVPELDPITGVVSVPAGTPAGIYDINYEICETAIPTNCSNAVARVVIGNAAPIPTLSEWAMILLSLMLMGVGTLKSRRFN